MSQHWGVLGRGGGHCHRHHHADGGHLHKGLQVPSAALYHLLTWSPILFRFCSVKTARAPPPLDPEEPRNTAVAVAKLVC